MELFDLISLTSNIFINGLLLEVPKVNLENFGRRAFACLGPTLWNKLPRNMHDNGNPAQFKKQLKTFLFST